MTVLLSHQFEESQSYACLHDWGITADKFSMFPIGVSNRKPIELLPAMRPTREELIH